jgi:hypothetical protein
MLPRLAQKKYGFGVLIRSMNTEIAEDLFNQGLGTLQTR